VNEGYAATGPPTLSYDYPYTEVNGGNVANSVSTFHPQANRTRRSKKSSKRNSTNTLGYIEVDQDTQFTSSGYITLRQSNGSSVAEELYSTTNQRTSVTSVTEEPSNSPVEKQTDTNNLLSPTESSSASQNIQTNTDNNAKYMTIHS